MSSILIINKIAALWQSYHIHIIPINWKNPPQIFSIERKFKLSPTPEDLNTQ